MRDDRRAQILQVLIACSTALIVGRNATPATIARTKEIAIQGSMHWFHAVIGRSAAQPFMEAKTGARAVFDGTGIIPAAQVCRSCEEPISSDKSYCPWCSITEDDALGLNTTSRIDLPSISTNRPPT